MQKEEQKLVSVGCPKINFIVCIEILAMSVFYERLGYVVDPVVALSRRLTEDHRSVI
jgi:hypothetical protein